MDLQAIGAVAGIVAGVVYPALGFLVKHMTAVIGNTIKAEIEALRKEFAEEYVRKEVYDSDTKHSDSRLNKLETDVRNLTGSFARKHYSSPD